MVCFERITWYRFWYSNPMTFRRLIFLDDIDALKAIIMAQRRRCERMGSSNVKGRPHQTQLEKLLADFQNVPSYGAKSGEGAIPPVITFALWEDMRRLWLL